MLWWRLPRPLRRLLVVSAASVLFGLGMIFSVLPGPGLPLLVAGLATLAVEFAWARTYLDRLRLHGDRLQGHLRRRLGNRPARSRVPGVEDADRAGDPTGDNNPDDDEEPSRKR